MTSLQQLASYRASQTMEAVSVKTLTAESPRRQSAINPWGTSPQTVTAHFPLPVVMDEELAKMQKRGGGRSRDHTGPGNQS